jgi:hypothetical protein
MRIRSFSDGALSILALRKIRTQALVAGCLLVVGCTASPLTIDERHLERAAAQLQRRPDADSLAAAGLLRVTKSRAQAVALMARAEAAAPTRADLVWLHLRACREVPTCDPLKDEQKLRTLSPANGAGWVDALAHATAARDEAAADAALIAIAHSERVDTYWTTLVGHLSAAAARTGKLSPAEAMIDITGMMAAMALPDYSRLSNSCKGDRLQRDDIREFCRGLAAALENGDTVITEMMGVAIAKRVWPEGSAQWQAAVERRRVYEYRSTLLRALKPVSWSTTQAQAYIALCLDYPSEQAVLREQLIAAGKDPDPPKS